MIRKRRIDVPPKTVFVNLARAASGDRQESEALVGPLKQGQRPVLPLLLSKFIDHILARTIEWIIVVSIPGRGAICSARRLKESN